VLFPVWRGPNRKKELDSGRDIIRCIIMQECMAELYLIYIIVWLYAIFSIIFVFHRIARYYSGVETETYFG
jgi:hypothetical protein